MNRNEYKTYANCLQDVRSDAKAQEKRYCVKPPREMRSSFERRQEEKKQEEVHAAMLKQQHEAQRLQEVMCCTLTLYSL